MRASGAARRYGSDAGRRRRRRCPHAPTARPSRPLNRPRSPSFFRCLPVKQSCLRAGGRTSRKQAGSDSARQKTKTKTLAPRTDRPHKRDLEARPREREPLINRSLHAHSQAQHAAALGDRVSHRDIAALNSKQNGHHEPAVSGRALSKGARQGGAHTARAEEARARGA